MNGRAMKPRIAASIARNPASLLIISDDFFKSANNTFKKGPITRSTSSGRWKISEFSISLLIVKKSLHTLHFLVPVLVAHALSGSGPSRTNDRDLRDAASQRVEHKKAIKVRR